MFTDGAVSGGLLREALGLAGVDMARLQAAINDPAGAGVGSIEDVSMILGRTRHLEDVVRPGMVVQLVRGIDGVARALAGQGAGGQVSGVVASEVARYREWLEHATGNPHSADQTLGDAARLADEGGGRSQLAHALSFRAYTSRHCGDLARAVDLTEAAIAVTGAHPILGVYDRYQRAELLAWRGGDTYRATCALHRADAAAEATDGIDLPAFGYRYTAGFWGIERGIVLAVMGRRTDAVREASDGVAALPAEHQGAEWVASLLSQIDPDMSGG